MASLKGKTLFISGASRGIGLAIALRAARDGANVAIAAKTAEPHPRLKGTIYTAADEIREVDQLQRMLHDDLAALVYDRLARRPMVLPVVVEV